MNTVERARNRWREILPSLGIDTRFLTNKHGPCPLCGGRDRYRFDDKDGDGTYFCNQCGAGTGLIMVRKKHGWDHKTACDEVDKILGDSKPAELLKPTPPRDCDRRLRAIERVLSAPKRPDIVPVYLQRRGLSVTSAVLQGDARCAYFNEDRQLVGHFPAVVAPIIGPDNSLQSAFRIYFGDDFTALGIPRKKPMPPVDTIAGGAVRLFDPEDELGVAEGIETALAAYQLFGTPTWAALSDVGLKAFQPPPGLLRLQIFADHDSSFVGQAAAFDLAKRLGEERPDLMVEMQVPPDADTDWLDILNRAGKA